MEGNVVGGIVQPDVFKIIVAGSPRVFKCGRLKNGYADSPPDKGFRLTGVDKLGLKMFEFISHQLFLHDRLSKKYRS
jgi:hypothetical protein